MGKKCCVPKCRSGYAPIKGELEFDGEKKVARKISVFSFPIEEDLLQRWVRSIPRDKWKPSSNSGVCELHFVAADIVSEREDSNKRRGKKDDLKLRRLKSDAVPTIFNGCPSYLSKVPKRRSGGIKWT